MNLCCDILFFGNSTSQVSFAGMEATLAISDMRSEWELRLGACIKDHALTTGGLPRLPHEELLAGGRATSESSCKAVPSRGEYIHQVWGIILLKAKLCLQCSV